MTPYMAQGAAMDRRRRHPVALPRRCRARGIASPRCAATRSRARSERRASSSRRARIVGARELLIDWVYGYNALDGATCGLVSPDRGLSPERRFPRRQGVVSCKRREEAFFSAISGQGRRHPGVRRRLGTGETASGGCWPSFGLLRIECTRQVSCGAWRTQKMTNLIPGPVGARCCCPAVRLPRQCSLLVLPAPSTITGTSRSATSTSFPWRADRHPVANRLPRTVATHRPAIRGSEQCWRRYCRCRCDRQVRARRLHDRALQHRQPRHRADVLRQAAVRRGKGFHRYRHAVVSSQRVMVRLDFPAKTVPELNRPGARQSCKYSFASSNTKSGTK